MTSIKFVSMVSRDKIQAQVSAYLTKRFLAKGAKLEATTPFADFGIDSMCKIYQL